MTFPPLSPLAPSSSEHYMSAISSHNTGLRRLEQVVLRNSLSRGLGASQVIQTGPAERQESMPRRAMVMLGDRRATEGDMPATICECRLRTDWIRDLKDLPDLVVC